MNFKELSSYLKRLEETPSRNEMTQILSDLFKRSNGEEIDKIVYLVLGQLAPNYTGLVLNIAEKMMFRVIAKAYKLDIKIVEKTYK
jgi:DNA ligase-1